MLTQSPVRPRETEDSLFTWFFLFCAIIVLPCAVIAHLWEISIDQSQEAQIKQARQSLEQKSKLVQGFLQPAAIARDVATIATRSHQQLVSLAKALEKKCPGTFKWQAWNARGELLPLPAETSLNGKLLWADLAREYYLCRENIFALHAGKRSQDQLIQRFQRYLGPKVRAETFIGENLEPFEFDWLGQPHLAVVLQAPQKNKQSLAGLIVFVRLAKLTDEFRFHWVTQKAFSHRLPADISCAWLNLDTIQQSCLLPPLPRSLDFIRRLKKAFLSRHDSSFIVDSWLTNPLVGNPENSEQIVLLTNLTGLHRNTSAQKQRVLLFLFLLLACSFGIMVAIRRGALSHVSLRWRIAGLFGLAIFLPTAALLYFFNILVLNERERGKAIVAEQFREVGNQLSARYQEFPRRYGKALCRKLERDLQQASSEKTVLRVLESWLDQRIISHYALSDTRGELSCLNSRQPLDKDSQRIIKLLLRVTFKDHLGESGADTSMGEVLLDEAGAMTKEGKNKPLRLSRPTLLKRYTYGNFDHNIMYVLPRIDGAQRVLLLDVENKLLARAFSTEELRANRYAGKQEKGVSVELFFDVFRGLVRVPTGVPLWKNPTIVSALERADEFTGELDVEGESFLYFVPKYDEKGFCRPVLLSSLNPILRKVAFRRQEFLIASGFAVCVAFLLGLVLAIRLLVPLGKIDSALRVVGEGNLAVELPSMGQDEIGRMSLSFNSMVHGLREKERMRAYVSETVLEAVKEDRSTVIHAGELIDATILFTDIRSFTTLCESNPPAVIFKMLNDFFSGAEKIIRLQQGRVDKFIGDAIMAVFLNENQALRAVLAAGAIKEFLHQLNAQRQQQGLFPMDIGIGISTGRVMLGDIGSETRKDLTVIGDEVNLAARLEAASKNGKHTHIILSETTRAAIPGTIETWELPQTTVKGKNQAVRMFELVNIPTLSYDEKDV